MRKAENASRSGWAGKSNTLEHQSIDTQRILKDGEAFFREEKLVEARTCFLRVLEADPDHVEALNNLGVILFHDGQSERAKDLFKKILAKQPASIDALTNLFDVMNAEGRSSEIIHYLEEAFKRSPGNGQLSCLVQTIKDQIVLSDLRQKGSFFILSCGLSGSRTLSKILSTADGVICYHSCRPDLEQAALDVYRKKLDKSEYLVRNFFPFISKDLEHLSAFGETAPAIIPFADQLAEVLPKAKFIILVRSPLTYCRSALFQNFYLRHPDDAYRFIPTRETNSDIHWERMSQVEKICWLWNESLNVIDAVTESIEPSRIKVIPFEDLFDLGTISGIFDFLNLKGFSPASISEILKSNPHVKTYGRFPSVTDWSPEFIKKIENLSFKHAVKHGYVTPNAAVAAKGSNPPVIRTHKGPDVTIGLPLYSGGSTLKDSVEAILSQDFENIELIISDHGSDPFVREIGTHYQKLDSRVTYVRPGDNINYIGIHNLARMIELSTAPYFMWGSWDDRIESSFISRCLDVLEKDESIALVYPKSKVFDENCHYVGPGADTVKADSNDPFDRFIHVIWELQMCNAFYGLFRRSYMRRTRSLHKNCYAHDNLFLAEISLLGKIIQIDDVLFIRRLTRNYNLRLDEHHADMLHSADPLYLEEGLTLPFCRFTYAHCELVNHSSLPPARKELLTREILRCFKQRWAVQLNYELNRLIQFLKEGVYYHTWDGRTYPHDLRQTPYLHDFHVTDILKSIREALFIFPEHAELREVHEASLRYFNVFPHSACTLTQTRQEVLT